jgi:hypothetical protein
MSMPLHRGLADYLGRHGAGQAQRRRDGSIVLLFDGRFRVLCRPLPDGGLLLESLIGELPPLARERAAVATRLLEALGENLVEHAETIALAADGAALVLQQQVPAEGDSELFTAELERHVNALGAWRGMMGVL